jgi:hypothetical protein
VIKYIFKGNLTQKKKYLKENFNKREQNSQKRKNKGEQEKVKKERKKGEGIFFIIIIK